MDIKTAFSALAIYYGLDADELQAFADEDKIGGYESNNDGKTTREGNPLWSVGSLWEVEGKILYALIRAIRPAHVIEVGSFHGCSTTHICEALLKNEKGKLTCVDITRHFKPPPRYKRILRQVKIDLFKFEFPKSPKVDFLFEDAVHSPEQVTAVWGQFKLKAKKGAAILSHDSEHKLVGSNVRGAVGSIAPDFQSILVEPSDCGLAYWRKP